MKHCYGNETETFVGESPEEAFKLYLEWGSGQIDDDHTIGEWDELADDSALNLFFEDRDIGRESQAVVPPEAIVYRKELYSTVFRATYAQWAAVEPGFLCTTEY